MLPGFFAWPSSGPRFAGSGHLAIMFRAVTPCSCAASLVSQDSSGLNVPSLPETVGQGKCGTEQFPASWGAVFWHRGGCRENEIDFRNEILECLDARTVKSLFHALTLRRGAGSGKTYFRAFNALFRQYPLTYRVARCVAKQKVGISIQCSAHSKGVSE